MGFVEAYDTETGKKLAYPVPEHYIDHPLLGRRLRRTPSSVVIDDVEVTIPDGNPTENWTVRQIDAWADALDVEFDEHATKAEKLAAIDELTTEPDPTETPDTGNKE